MADDAEREFDEYSDHVAGLGPRTWMRLAAVAALLFGVFYVGRRTNAPAAVPPAMLP